MSNTVPVKSHGALSAEQKEIIANKRVDAQHTPEQWVVMLTELAAFDAQGDARRVRAGWWCAGLVVLTIISLAVFAPLAILTVIGAIVALVLFFRLKKVDIPNALRESVLPIVVLLREEMERDDLLTLRFDLHKTDRKENLLRSADLSGKSYPRIEESYYRNAWLAGGGVLADGTALEWAVTDDLRDRKVTKRNPRGKIKIKHKYKVRRVIEMRLGMRTDAYAVTIADEGKTKGVKMSMKEGEKRNVVKMHRRFLLNGSPQPTLDPRSFIDTLAGAYRHASLVTGQGNRP